MFKLILIIGMIVLFNVLSRKINNIAQQEQAESSSVDDSLDQVWDNLERLAKEKKVETTIESKPKSEPAKPVEQKKQGEAVFRAKEKVEDLFISDDEGETLVEDFGVKMAHTQMRKPLPSKKERFHSFPKATDSSMEKSPSAGDLQNKYVDAMAKYSDYAATLENESAKGDISTQISEIEKHDLAQQDVAKVEKFAFSSNPVINGIIFSEILAKPKAKR